ncbi:hypothetical protein [Natronoglycomyces albus]|uniref:Uncharacterized protein n=1 Tax=Natronoglycomyces albus TaxID=2811108 RepID=A0A895XUK5_9ACTN|nr:hypothetical protein [Natronoglycomyces albus]QSB07153.1 hypothetical protein JQS30_17070 [Natronoglycomyces albus]
MADTVAISPAVAPPDPGPGTWLVDHKTRARRARSRARQMEALTRTTQPIIRLAAIIAKLDIELPRRRGKRLEMLLAYMTVLSDWRSGRRSRPGRDTSAALLGITADHVRKLWRRLEALELIERTATGQHLAHDEVKRQPREEYHVVQRSEWTLPAPEGIYAEDVQASHIDRALAALAAVAELLATLDDGPAETVEVTGHMVAAWRSLMSERANQEKDSYCCPIYRFISSTLPSRSPSSLPKAAYGRTWQEAATKEGQKRQRRAKRRAMNPQALELARSLRNDSRLPQLKNAPLPILVNSLTARANAGWTASDVVKAVQRAVEARNSRWGYYDPPINPDKSIAWLSRLLGEVADIYPVQRPPHVVAEEAAEASRARQAARRTAAPAVVRTAGDRRRARIQVPRRRRGHRTTQNEMFDQTVAGRARVATTPPVAAQWAPPQPTGPQCALCGHSGPDVDHRALLGRGNVEVCSGCHHWHTHLARLNTTSHHTAT